MDNKANWDIERLQEQIWSLKKRVDQLEMENELLKNEITLIKNEGCALSKDILERFSDDGK